MTDNLLRFQNNQKYVIFDVETANLNGVNGLPWQIGWLTAKGKNPIETFDRKIFWPNYKIEDSIAAMNHFDRYAYERDARPPGEVLDEFESYLYDPEYLVVTMNGFNFDAAIHNSWRKKLGRRTDYSWLNRHLDILPLFRAIQIGVKTADKNDLICWQYRYINHRDRKIKASLSAQLKYFGIPFNEAEKHDACVDIRLTFEVFQKIIWAIEI